MKVIIDRFEGDFAVVEVEKGVMADLPRLLVPDGREGDVVSIEIDRDETKARTDRIAEKAKKLWI